MAHLQIQAPGVLSSHSSAQKKIVRVTSGDTWKVGVNLYSPTDPTTPATPETTFVSFALAETQFEKPFWTGEWYRGVKMDATRRDLQWLAVPPEITKSLRRGSYQFSVRVSDILKTTYVTEVQGSFLVEYTPTSENHDIPYKSQENRPNPPAPDPEEGPSGSYVEIDPNDGNMHLHHICRQTSK